MSRTQRSGRWLPALAASVAALAAAALYNRRSAERAVRKYPPPGDFLELDGALLHYVERGTGAPIVLLHGNGSLVQDFLVSGVVDRLAMHHRVILFDRPGYGYTSRSDKIDWTPERQAALFLAACDVLGMEQPVVVGHSWGTLAALAWALDHPDRVTALVLASGYYYPTARADAAMLKVVTVPLLRELYDNTLLPLQTRLTGPLGIRMIFAPAKTTPKFMHEMPFELMLRPSQLAATAEDGAQMVAAARRLAARYAELALPITVITGDGDMLVDPEAQSARFAAETGAEAVVIEHAGHMVQHIDPDRVATAIETRASPGANVALTAGNLPGEQPVSW